MFISWQGRLHYRGIAGPGGIACRYCEYILRTILLWRAQNIPEGNGQFRVLAHGTTLHGAIRIKNPDGSKYAGAVTPLTYYHPKGVLAQTLQLLPPLTNGRDLAVVGLGTGAHACNGVNDDRWTYFEIDPVVIKIAKDPEQFGFLSTCAPSAKIILGDARLTLAEQP